ncbi:NAD(P)H:quinone oxidoreductase [Amycolatopsis acidiphila]|uniref:NAD(P)H:quinone oxidoreductase n=1 Tax=Amycolatopsis acidiphila TaxID=715473 RepID=A0A557ZNP9_9PSEU|nr:NAD(P)H:quinone oxidoreductase [Amycolatopsis acidiphila]TVT13649.1 NAD(P)H:quinone oxidoreductase [Amycolatopsis acidiphila]UIJ62120.1 NAD(P)H:quinone oxidoreductase [Amycolatopsis acidiphila]GHG91967.1 TrpR-binding protein WrbA [Amycolatopsis acidiphila]
MDTRILVVFYSATGNTAALAASLAEGAREAGAEVRLRTVAETAPPQAIATNPRWQAYVDSGPHAEPATLEDLTWADGLAVGSPTRFGGPAAQLKSYLDTTGGLWAQGKLANKVATSFTTASTAHGGLESTVLAINNVFYHWGAIVVPLGYAHPHLMGSGNPYGGSFVSRRSAAPDDEALGALRIQGNRLATIAGYVAAGLRAG